MPSNKSYAIKIGSQQRVLERTTVKTPGSSQSVDIGDGAQTTVASGLRTDFDDVNPPQLRYNFTSNGTSPVWTWYGGEGVFSVLGDGGGGTYTLQKRLQNGTNWQSVGSDTTIAGSGEGSFVSQLCDLRIVATGATSPNVETSIGYSQLNM